MTIKSIYLVKGYQVAQLEIEVVVKSETSNLYVLLKIYMNLLERAC
jgi:hypothetical protein